MTTNSLGDIIRSLRKKYKLSQEELADGICSPVSISRIENGTQMPSGAVLEALLTKLGTSTYQLCDIYYKSEKQLTFEKDAEKISNLIAIGNIAEAQKELFHLKDRAKINNQNLQYYLLLDASIKLYEGYNPQDILSILYEAFAQTKPSFDFDDFRNVLLSVREANILNIIVVSFYRSDDILKAIRLGEELMSSLKRQKSSLKEYQIIKINLAFNLAQCLEKEHRFKEALSYIQMAEDLSIKSFEQALLPEIEFIKAKMYHLLNNDNECIHIIQAIVPYMELIHKSDFAKIVRTYAEKELHLCL
ncbi:MAG TPA: transcriptional regulator [Lachnospiraceae bacterium]|nr:transcriptional regulator [Lachnospiraceae bacterium]